MTWTDQSVVTLQDINVFTEVVVRYVGKLVDNMVAITTIRTFPYQKS